MIAIMGGGGINEANAARIVKETGVTEIHVGATNPTARWSFDGMRCSWGSRISPTSTGGGNGLRASASIVEGER